MIGIKTEDFQLISVDIFDTLLFRLVSKPSDIFEKLGQHAAQKEMLHHSITPNEFALLRASAEQEARKLQLGKMGHNEVNLSEIYECLPPFVVNKTQIEALELEVECEFCYLNPDVLEFIYEANSLNIAVVLTSDMYLNKFQLEQILRSNGFDLSLVKEIYVSSEHQCNKASGKLFEKLLSEYAEIKPEESLHLGDKLDADVNLPRSLGMRSYHYSVIPNVIKAACDYEKICQNTPQHLNSLRKLAVHTSGDANLIENQIGAGILGPVLTCFCEWILDICEAEGKDRVYPFMREAEMFVPMLENASRKRNLAVKVTPLYVSRHSTWLASLDHWNQEECENLLGKHGITVSEIFLSLNLEFLAVVEGFADSKIKDLPTEISDLLITHLTSDITTSAINQKIEVNHGLLLSYLEKHAKGFDECVTVDLGFRGTINNYIEKALAKKGANSKIIHLLAFGADSIIELKKKCLDIRCFLASPGINQDFLKVIQRSSFPLEQMILGQTGSTKGYEARNNRTIPLLDEASAPPSECKIKQDVLKSTLGYQNLWYSLYDTKKSILRKTGDSTEERRMLCGLIYRMIDTPTLEEAKLLGDLNHDFNNGSMNSRKICSNNDSRLLKEIGSEEKILKVGRMHGVHWPQGILTRSNPYFLLKRKLAQHTSDSYLQSMNDLVEIVKAKGFSKIIIYGAGEAGKALYKAAEINEVKIGCFVDRKESLWGEYVESAQVLSLDTAFSEFDKIPFVIGSFEFLEQIENSIRSKTKELEHDPIIFSTKDL
ncbi:MAG: HAD family hydrolase [Opitutales bacterium]